MHINITPQEIRELLLYIEEVTEKRVDTVLPGPFFSEHVTSEVFFKKIEECGFTAKERNCAELNKVHYLGETLFAQPVSSLISKKISNLQQQYGVTETHIKNRELLRKEFDGLVIGDLFDFHKIEPLFVFYKQHPDSLFGDKVTKKFIEKCDAIRKYCLVAELMWYARSYESILNDTDAVPL